MFIQAFTIDRVDGLVEIEVVRKRYPVNLRSIR